MTDIDYQVRDLKTRIETAQGKRLTADHEQRVAQAAADQAMKQLKVEFGCESIEQAQVLLEQLEAALDTECHKVADQLAVAEGSS